ncbi:Transient receptor potential channel pyrexia [Gryllus bimaculatus]|nr:Transient receptor potential channel pyrexia [Gryllus bimaculatus]
MEEEGENEVEGSDEGSYGGSGGSGGSGSCGRGSNAGICSSSVSCTRRNCARSMACGASPSWCPAPTCGGSRICALGKNLLKAAQKGRTCYVERLLDAGADANYSSTGDWTALHRAAAKAHACVVSLLLKRGANVNARNCYGFTALHIAAYDDYRGKCVQLLIEGGADLGSRNRFGRTPLHYAAECGNVAAVRLLVKAGASKCAKDDEGRTPCDVAKTVCVRRLLRKTLTLEAGIGSGGCPFSTRPKSPHHRVCLPLKAGCGMQMQNCPVDVWLRVQRSASYEKTPILRPLCD